MSVLVPASRAAVISATQGAEFLLSIINCWQSHMPAAFFLFLHVSEQAICVGKRACGKMCIAAALNVCVTNASVQIR